MRNKPAIGSIVWHDLISADPQADMDFFRELMGWSYTIEKSDDFVWKSGPGEYPLIMADGEAHGGVVMAASGEPSHWLAYVETGNVETCTERALALGATIAKDPFDIPGVGRSVVLSDPQGALICPFTTGHDYPPPGGQFIFEQLLTRDPGPAGSFYHNLFGWVLTAADGRAGGGDGRGFETLRLPQQQRAQWIPYLRASDIAGAVAHARDLGATVPDSLFIEAQPPSRALLASPSGAVFGLIA